MTRAVCYRCGAIKFGAFCTYTSCNIRPKTEDDLVVSLAMTDHYFDLETLEQIGQSIQDEGTPPDLAPETRRSLQETIRSSGIVNSLEGIDEGPPAALLPKRNPWWKFW